MTETYSKETILANVVEILNSITSDWDMDYSGGITAQTRLIEDLGFESIDTVQFVGAVGEYFKIKTLPFEEILITDGNYVDELLVSDIVEFLCKHQELL